MKIAHIPTAFPTDIAEVIEGWLHNQKTGCIELHLKDGRILLVRKIETTHYGPRPIEK